MPNRFNAHFFEILISQILQNIKINIVLSKALSVLVHAELFEPVRNLLHHSLPVAGMELVRFKTRRT